TPSIGTTLSDDSIGIGGTVHDSSSLTGATADASGTVKYRWYSSLTACNAGTYDTPGGNDIGDVTVAGDVVPDSNTAGPFDTAGTYYFRAFYSGDNNNTGPVSSACTDEELTVNPNTPSIGTTLSHDSITVGGTVHDSATLTGETQDASGTVEYRWYSSLSDCQAGTYDTPGGTSAGDVTVTDGSVPDSNDVTFNNAGTYYFRAFYSGDNNNDGASSACSEEVLQVSKASPSIETLQDPASGSAGDTYKDKATLSGTVNQDETDRITWNLYPNNDCTGTSLDTETLSINDNGTFETPTGVKLDTPGTYYWVASYSGDSNNLAVSSGCADEQVLVKPAAIHIVKTADAAKVNVGSPIGFTMTVYNAGTGDAYGVKLHDTLPTNPGLSWSVASQGAGWAGSCSISAGVLTCGGANGVTVPAGTTQAASTFTVHIVSGTTGATGGDCPGSGTVDNTGNVTTSNDGSDQSSASTCVQALVDLSITKAGSPASQTLGDGNITWTIVVTNNGPSADTGVTIADPMPAGNTFVSATTSKGSCTGGAILNCTIGNMAAGESVTITLVTTPSAAGPQVNTATVAGNRPETNTGNNSATATVQVVGVFKPVFCVAVSKVTPKQLFVGRKTKLTIHVTQHAKAVKGVHVRIKGPKINIRTKASNSKGVITAHVKMKKAGILIFSPIASQRCNTKRVGVTNVFTPPVTG
ncbi:MAG TPA: DUF11 domain-containing protein, partial [Gaiellaceae bacterium]|nr:DUF11 domain-containing protein [Gaiellaceae bacterium]